MALGGCGEDARRRYLKNDLLHCVLRRGLSLALITGEGNKKRRLTGEVVLADGWSGRCECRGLMMMRRRMRP